MSSDEIISCLQMKQGETKETPPTIFQVLSYNIDKKVCSRIDSNTHLGMALLPFA